MGRLIFSAMVVPAFAKDSCNRSSRKDSIIKAFFFQGPCKVPGPGWFDTAQDICLGY